MSICWSQDLSVGTSPSVESGAASEIIIARSGRPTARLVPPAPIAVDRGRRIGVANGRFEVPEPDVALDAEVQRLLEGWAP